MSEETSSGASVLLQGIELGYINVPLHHVFLESDLVTGPVSIGVRKELPFEGITFLMGNDLAGAKEMVDPIVSSKPLTDKPDHLASMLPMCVVTRSMSTRNKSLPKVDMEDTFLPVIYDNDVDEQKNNHPKLIQTVELPMNRDQLILPNRIMILNLKNCSKMHFLSSKLTIQIHAIIQVQVC